MRTLSLTWSLLWRTTFAHGVFQSILFLAIYSIFGFESLFESALKLKPTIANWAFAALLTFTATVFGRSLIGSILGSRLQITADLWRIFDIAVVAIFIGLGALNWAIAETMSTDSWVNYKLFGSSGIYLFLMVSLAGWISRQKSSNAV